MNQSLILLIATIAAASAKSVIETKAACSVSSEIHTALVKFETSASSSITDAKTMLATRKSQYTAAKKEAVQATMAHTKAKAARAAAHKASVDCSGVLSAYNAEFKAQKPLIDNELQCVSALEKVVDRLSNTKIEDLEEVKQYRDTETFKAATSLLERSSGTTLSLRKLLKKLKSKLEGEIAALKSKIKKQTAKCASLASVLKIKTAAASVAKSSQERAEKKLANANKAVMSAATLLSRTTKDSASESFVMANIRSNTNKVCKGKRLKTSKHNVCTMRQLIVSLFKTRAREHRRHTAALAGLTATRKQAKADIGPAVAKRDAAKKAMSAAVSASESCAAAEKAATATNIKMQKVIKKELSLVKLLREKAGCLTRATRKTRTDCRTAKAAMSQLQESPVAGATTALVELARKHGEVDGVLALLAKLEKALQKESASYTTALAARKRECVKLAKKQRAATQKYKGAVVVVNQVTSDYKKAKRNEDAYAAVVRQFNSERAAEEKSMRAAVKHMSTFAKTKWGKKWSQCNEEELEEIPV